MNGAAVDTLQVLMVAVYFKHPTAPGLLVQAVDILGNDARKQSHGFHCSQHLVRVIGLFVDQDFSHSAKQLPGLGRIAAKHIKRGVLFRGKDAPKSAS